MKEFLSKFYWVRTAFFATKKSRNQGFTLVEMIVSIGIFSMVVVVATGAIFTIIRTNQKVQATKSVMENLNFAIESMSRVIRFSKNYHCSNLGNFSTPRDCNYPSGSSFIAFKDYRDGLVKSYRLNGTSLERGDENNVYIPVTAPEVVVTSLNFYVEGAESSTLQPKVKVVLQGYAGTKADIRSSFNIETTISQRDVVFN